MVRQFPSTLPSVSASQRAALARWRLVNPAQHRPVRSLSTAVHAQITRPCASALSPSPHQLALSSSSSRRLFATTSAVDASSLLLPSLPRLYPRRTDPKAQSLKEGEEEDGNEGEDGDRSDVNKRQQQPPSKSDEGFVRSSSSSGESTGASSEGGQSTPPSSDSGDDAAPPSSSGNSLSRRSVPDVYPQVLALPITRRPLFPGFYKAVVIRNPAVISAIKESIKRGQPYIGAFLLKDENADSDM